MRGAAAILALGIVLAGCIPAGTSRPSAPSPQDTPARPDGSIDPETLPPDEQATSGDDVTQLPAPRPAWESRPVAPDARIVPAQRYRVRPGDTLSGVADRTGAAAEAIARANRLNAPFVLRAGRTLTIPAGRYHRVVSGQTGIAIARGYGIPWSRLIALNHLVEPYLLRAGQRVLVPSEDSPSISAADRAAAFTLDVDTILTGGEPALAANRSPALPVAGARRVLSPTTAVVAPAVLPGRFLWPVDGTLVSRFGPGRTGERNDGIKIAVPLDTPIRAAADGTVAYVGDGIAALGGLVIVRHGGGWSTVYGHAGKLLVQRGQAVTKGQTVALSGESGYADRPEVHFELRRGRAPVDPTTQLPRR